MMFFTRIAWIAAVVALALGILQILMGVSIASGMMGPIEEALHRYSAAPSTGALIDGVSYKVLFAIALGTLAEISKRI